MGNIRIHLAVLSADNVSMIQVLVCFHRSCTERPTVEWSDREKEQKTWKRTVLVDKHAKHVSIYLNGKLGVSPEKTNQLIPLYYNCNKYKCAHNKR